MLSSSCPKGGRAAPGRAGSVSMRRCSSIAISSPHRSPRPPRPLHSVAFAAAAVSTPTRTTAAARSRPSTTRTTTAASASPSGSENGDVKVATNVALSPSARAADTVTRFYAAWNAADPDGAVADMAPDVEYWDTIYEQPFIGKENVRAYFAKAARVLGPAVKFVVDGLSPAEDGSAVGVKWHCELDDGTPLPNSRGCSFYELREGGRVLARARDFVEPSVKPGAATLYLLRAVLPLVRLAARFDAEKKKKEDGGGNGGGGEGGGGGGPSSSGSDVGGGSSIGGVGGGDSLAFAFGGLSSSSSQDAAPSASVWGSSLAPLSLFGGRGRSGGSGSNSSSSSIGASPRPLSSPPPPPAPTKHSGSLTTNSALVWLFYVAYFSFVFFSRELPGLPVLETPPEVLTEVLHESWTFYYFVPVFNLLAAAAALPAGLRIPDLPEHPASEALFNFVNAWSMMMLPVMLAEAPRALPPSKKDGAGGGDDDKASSSSNAAFKWWLGVQFLTNVFMIPYMALRAREGGPGNDLVPEAWKEEKVGSQKGSKKNNVEDEDSKSAFPSWTPAIGLAGASIGVLSILWALYARPEVAAELGAGLLSDGGASGDSLEGRWAWAARALSSNRATWAFALDSSLYAVWQAAMLKDAAPLERFVPFFGMAAYLMRSGGGGRR